MFRIRGWSARGMMPVERERRLTLARSYASLARFIASESCTLPTSPPSCLTESCHSLFFLTSSLKTSTKAAKGDLPATVVSDSSSAFCFFWFSLSPPSAFAPSSFPGACSALGCSCWRLSRVDEKGRIEEEGRGRYVAPVDLLDLATCTSVR